MTSASSPQSPIGSAEPFAQVIDRRAARRRAWRLSTLTRYLYLVPMLVLVGGFLLYPAADTFWISFTNWDGLNDAKFIGLKNYSLLVNDPAFVNALTNTLLWVVGVLVLQVTLGLLVALVLSNVRAGTFLKTVFYLPSTISAAATGVIWFFMFDPNEGVINSALRLIHLNGFAQDWLTNTPTNTWAMIVAATWQGLGPNMMLFLVGLAGIPKEPLEAALIDGAGGVRLFWHMTLPLLRPMLTVVVGIALINSFKVFDLIWVMTQGGPYRSSETLAVTMYREAFVSFQLGYGASVAIVLSIIVLVVSIFYLRSMFRRDQGVY